jgi:hypothetical protein
VNAAVQLANNRSAIHSIRMGSYSSGLTTFKTRLQCAPQFGQI